MPAFLSWIDHDSEERERMNRILAPCREREMRRGMNSGLGPCASCITDPRNFRATKLGLVEG